MTAPKRLALPWIVAILMAMPLFYMLSIGPANWAVNTYTTPLTCRVYAVYTKPSDVVFDVSPQPVKRAISAYIGLFPNERLATLKPTGGGPPTKPPAGPVRFAP